MILNCTNLLDLLGYLFSPWFGKRANTVQFCSIQAEACLQWGFGGWKGQLSPNSETLSRRQITLREWRVHRSMWQESLFTLASCVEPGEARKSNSCAWQMLEIRYPFIRIIKKRFSESRYQLELFALLARDCHNTLPTRFELASELGIFHKQKTSSCLVRVRRRYNKI